MASAEPSMQPSPRIPARARPHAGCWVRWRGWMTSCCWWTSICWRVDVSAWAFGILGWWQQTTQVLLHPWPGPQCGWVVPPVVLRYVIVAHMPHGFCPGV